MNLLFLYVGIFLAILAIAIAIKILKNVFKVVFFAFFVVLIFLGITGYLVVKDANEFKERFPEDEKIFLLMQEEKLIAGFALDGLNAINSDFLNKEELEEAYLAYNSGTLDNDTYKIFLVQYSAFDEVLEEGFEFDGLTIDKELADEVFESDDPLTVLAKEIAPNNYALARQELVEDLGTSEEAKGAMFAVLFTTGLNEGVSFLIDNMREDEIEVYPETPIFTVISVVPENIINETIGGENGLLEQEG